jgi:hypothetical protein
MKRIRKSAMLIIVGVVVAVFGVDHVFFGYTDNTPQRQQMPKVSGAKNTSLQTRDHVISPESSTSTLSSTTRTAASEALEIQGAMDESALPNEFTIPSELLYLDDQPTEFDSETNDESLRMDEGENQPAEEIDAIPPDADTIPAELLDLDNKPAENDG